MCSAARTTRATPQGHGARWGLSGEVLYPSQGLLYFKVADTALMSAIFRAYNDLLAEFCRTDPARLKGNAMINLDDIPEGIRELERAACLCLAGATITEYPFEDRRYDQSRIRDVLGRRGGAQHATEPPHGHATAGQDPRGRRRGAARRKQPRDEGVLSGAVDVRPDLLRRLRGSSQPDIGHRRVRGDLGALYTLHHGLYLPSATARRSTGSRTLCSRAILSAATSYWASRRTPSAFASETSSASTT
jgi:hypothetical protein